MGEGGMMEGRGLPHGVREVRALAPRTVGTHIVLLYTMAAIAQLQHLIQDIDGIWLLSDNYSMELPLHNSFLLVSFL